MSDGRNWRPEYHGPVRPEPLLGAGKRAESGSGRGAEMLS